MVFALRKIEQFLSTAHIVPSSLDRLSVAHHEAELGKKGFLIHFAGDVTVVVAAG